MLRPSYLIPIALLAAGLLTAGCKRKVELFCDENTPCTDTVLNYCDLNGIHEASDYIGHTCIPDPFGADGGTPDADPNAPDAAPNAPDAGPQAKVSHVFYTDADKSGLHYTMITDGVIGDTHELSEPFASDGDQVMKFDVADDLSFVVYQSVELDVRSLYYVDLRTAPPAKAALISGGTMAITYAVGGSKVIFAEDPENDGTKDLYLVHVGNGAPSAPAPIGPNEGFILGSAAYQLSQDGEHVLFTSSADGKLYYSYLGGSVPSEPVPISDGSPYFQISPDSRSLVYLGELGHVQRTHLYHAPIVAGTVGGSTTLTGAVGVQIYSRPPMRFAPDGSFLVYLSDERTYLKGELFAVDLRGPTPAARVPINGSLVTDGDVRRFEIAADGSGVAYVADQTVDDVLELRYVDMRDPGSPAGALRASGGLVAEGDVRDHAFGFAKDGRHLYYLADQRVDERAEAYRVDVSSSIPGSPALINGPLTAGGDVYSAQLEGSGVLYRADQDTDTVIELYYARQSGDALAAATRVHPALDVGDSINGGSAWKPTIIQGGDAALYTALIGGTSQLWMVPLTGSLPATPVELNPLLASGAVSQTNVTVIEQP